MRQFHRLRLLLGHQSVQANLAQFEGENKRCTQGESNEVPVHLRANLTRHHANRDLKVRVGSVCGRKKR
eukprot:scaffold2257_cov424-Pavlova_lutheri.AAC.1